MASSDMSREELFAEVARLQARNEQLEAENAMLRQASQNEADKDSISVEESPRKKQKTQHGEQQLALGDGGRTDERSRHQQDDQQQALVADVNGILILPTDMIGKVLDFLEFSETRDFFVCRSCTLWERTRVEYESTSTLILAPSAPPPISDLINMAKLHTLNLGPHCSDTALAVLCHERACPQLTHLAMVGSRNVTDKGLGLLVENPNRCKNLLSLDITSCNGISLEVIFLLRDLLINLKVLCRQHKWMDGQVTFTSGKRTAYWADGVRALYGTNGEILECTYLQNLFEEGSNHRVVRKDQIVMTASFEDESWQSQPEWMRHAYRLGTTLLYLPESQSVMFAQPTRGLLPVQGFPRPEDAHSIPTTSARYFNRQGDTCGRNDPNAYACIAHVRIQPLETLMPPQDVLNLCRHQVQREKVIMVGREQEADERHVHIALGGNQDDVPPAYWFQQN